MGLDELSPDPSGGLLGQSREGEMVSTDTIRLAAVDDHPVVVEGIGAILMRSAPDVEWMGAARSFADLQAMVTTATPPPDLVLYDLHLHDDSKPADGIAWLTTRGVRSVVLTSELRPVPIRDAVMAGAMGVILKSDNPDRIIEVIRQASAGDFAVSSELAEMLVNDKHMTPHLAPRELEALELLASGLPRKTIGRRMDTPVAMSTVVTYFNRICEKYRDLGRDVHTPQEALRAAAQDGYLDTPEPQRDI